MQIRSRLALLRKAFGSLTDPGPDLYAIYGVQPSETGITVSPATAVMVPAVNAALRLISEAAATLPRMVQKRGEDGKWTDDPGHAANALLNESANDWTSGFEFIRDLMVQALSEDRGALAYAGRGGSGKVAELILYRAALLTVDYHPATGEPSYRLDNRAVPAADVIHVRPCFGRAPLTLAREAVAIAILLERHVGRLFGKGARPSGALMFPKGMGEESVKKSIAAWRTTHEGGDNSGKTAILHDGAEFKPFSFTSTDAQFIENRRFQTLEIARCFRVPPSMLFDLDRATWGNIEQLGKEFLIYCLDPWLSAVEGALNRVFFAGAEAKSYRIRFDRDDLSRADLQTRATTINSLIAAEVINPNEGRDWLGLGPYAGGETFGNRNINPDQGGRPPKEEVTNAA